jgi:hypothetical protein
MRLPVSPARQIQRQLLALRPLVRRPPPPEGMKVGASRNLGLADTAAASQFLAAVAVV